MNTVVAFDLGKVLVDFDYSIAARKIAASQPDVGRPASTVSSAIPTSPSNTNSAWCTRREFFEQIRQAIGFRGTFEEFGEFFADIFTEIPLMTALHAALRRRGVPTYIFSNTNDLAIEHIRRNFPFFKNFDGYIFSCEIGAMKPDAKIYEALEKLAGRRGAEIVYLDDRPENIAGGAARGWRAILHESPEKSRTEVEKCLS